jgi:hypothetical protein
MAMACFGLVTFLPLRPDLSVPRFISFISVSTFLLAEGEYFRPESFFLLLFVALLDFFFVAIVDLLDSQMAHPVNAVVQRGETAKPMRPQATREAWAADPQSSLSILDDCRE